jgi:hypothetical protein
MGVYGKEPHNHATVTGLKSERGGGLVAVDNAVNNSLGVTPSQLREEQCPSWISLTF